jgi:DHA1 family bicyclomycin/chloramphenicol resistance-like MFS transporter
MIFLSVTIGITLADLLCPVALILFLCGFIIPCSLAKSMSIFPNAAGTASSIFGTLTGIIVAFVTMFASTLKTSTQFSMSVTYFVLLSMNLTLVYACKKIENNK